MYESVCVRACVRACVCGVSSHLYLYSAFNNTNCNKARVCVCVCVCVCGVCVPEGSAFSFSHPLRIVQPWLLVLLHSWPNIYSRCSWGGKDRAPICTWHVNLRDRNTRAERHMIFMTERQRERDRERETERDRETEREREREREIEITFIYNI